MSPAKKAGVPVTADGEINWSRIATDLTYTGKQIVLPGEPEEMPLDTAIETLQRIKAQENQKFDVSELVHAAPWDSLVAIYRAMVDLYGVVLAESVHSFFGEIKPDMLTVKTGPRPTDRLQVPAGRMSLPGVSDPIQIGLHPQGAFIAGSVRKRDQARLIEIANRARELLKTQSVYRGRAIRFGVDDDGDLNTNIQPEFMDVAAVNLSDMIHTAETEGLIKTNIFSPLRHTEACRKHRIPLKRGILLEGRYGTGKSLTARVTAKVATDNGWTFVIIDKVQGLKAAIEFARHYQPCVIFAEDIDRAADREDEGVNDLINLIDGVITKDMEVMTILTTNFIEKIDRALLRPGRFDAVISIQPPDPDTVERLIRAYARELLPEDVELTKVGDVLDGQIPATIREVVERAKLSMLGEDRQHLSSDDLHYAAVGMQRHMALLAPPAEKASVGDRFVAVLGEVITGGGVDTSDLATKSGLEFTRRRMGEYVGEVRRDVSNLAPAVLAAAGNADKAKDLAKAASLDAAGAVKLAQSIKADTKKIAENF